LNLTILSLNFASILKSMLTIPEDIFATIKMTPAELRRELAIFLYAKNKLSFGQACKLAGLDVLQFQEVLFDNRIPLHYSLADFEDDFKAIHAYNSK
jgi:predicted HTH domain antitoxin